MVLKNKSVVPNAAGICKRMSIRPRRVAPDVKVTGACVQRPALSRCILRFYFYNFWTAFNAAAVVLIRYIF